MTHSYPSLYVRATYALVSCTAHLSNWTRQRTCYQHHESQCECFRPLHTLLGLQHPLYRDTNSLTPPVGYSGSLSTVHETCNKDKRHCTKKTLLSVHIFQVSPHIKIGCTPVRRTWELFKSSCWSLSMQVIKFASATGFPVLVPPFLLDTLWSILLKRKFELIVRVSLHDGDLPRWFGLCTGTWNLTSSVSGLSDALGQSDIENLSTILTSISPHHVFNFFSKKYWGNGSHRTCHELSTFVRWLSYVDIAWLVGLRDGSLRACSSALSHSINAGIGVEPVLSCGDDVGGDVPDELDEQKVVDKPGTTIATGFTWNRRRKTACWTNSWQVFSKYFSKQFWWGYHWSL